MEQEIIGWITDKIKKCNAMCFCNNPAYKKEGLFKDQKRCGNCHSKDILIELLSEVNDRDMLNTEKPPKR